LIDFFQGIIQTHTGLYCGRKVYLAFATMCDFKKTQCGKHVVVQYISGVRRLIWKTILTRFCFSKKICWLSETEKFINS